MVIKQQSLVDMLANWNQLINMIFEAQNNDKLPLWSLSVPSQGSTNGTDLKHEILRLPFHVEIIHQCQFQNSMSHGKCMHC